MSAWLILSTNEALAHVVVGMVGVTTGSLVEEEEEEVVGMEEVMVVGVVGTIMEGEAIITKTGGTDFSSRLNYVDLI